MSHDTNQYDFEQLFRQYYPMLCGIAFGYLRDNVVVEEIAGNVFVKYWNNRSTISIRTSIKDYLLKSVKNACK